ncbi:phenylacetate--CoA ligase family protein [Carboxylicivirga linearis]|uniref:Phenylacetate--CoA ligase family protein n=1 Tax=Carboxylicivirga linearis TaxID=1628157 RepID=A0ABS5JW18_9BACT|nr:phenylacetate--CoA ligase family protein [Carboxylicivirga linearis]MBS2099092.1 phenylacetate--CoA ligase family protein [Carboxylicivirga linearis]
MIKFKTLLRLEGLPIKKAQSLLSSIQTSTDLINWQNKQKWKILKYSYKTHPIYKSFIGTIPEEWESIPIISKEKLNTIKHPRFRSKFKKHLIRQTSGSTGKTLTYAVNSFCHAITWSIINDRYTSIGISLNHKQARFYGQSNNFTNRLFEQLKDRTASRYRIPILNLSETSIKKWIGTIEKKQVKYLYGYSYPIISLAKYLIYNGITLKDFNPSLSACIVTSEMCTPEEENLIERAFGVPCYNEYGASELGIIGFGKANSWLISDEQILVEIVDENDNIVPDGEVGRIICTNLFNKATPFIRYEVGDMGSIEIRNGRRYLKQLQGRQEETIYLPEGENAPGDTVFFYVIQDFSNKFPEVISEYRVIQKKLNHFQFLLVTHHPLSDSQQKYLIKLTKRSLIEDITITIKEVTEIDRTPLGKYRRFISEIEQ